MKKIITILLVISLLPIMVVSAADSAVMKKDGFESIEAGLIDTDLVKADAPDYGGYTSDLWRMDKAESSAIAWTGSFFFDGVQMLSLTPVMEGANTVMKVSKGPEAAAKGYSGVGAVTHEFTGEQTDDVVYVSFKIKVIEGNGYIGASESGAGFSGQLIAFSNECFRTVNGDWETAGGGVSHNNEWCTVLLVFDKSGATHYIYDNSGNLILTGSRAFSGTQSYSNARVIFQDCEGELYLDDGIMTVSRAGDGMAIASSTISDGSTKVSRKPDLGFGVTQPIQDASKLTCVITDEDDNVLSGDAYDLNVLSLFEADIEWNQLLDRATDYTVSLLYDGAEVGNIHFTTEDIHQLTPVTLQLDKADSEWNVIESDATSLTSGNFIINLAVEDPLNYPTFNGVMIVTVYTEDGLLHQLDFATLTDADFSALTSHITLTDLPANATLSVCLLDNMQSYMPLCTAIGF